MTVIYLFQQYDFSKIAVDTPAKKTASNGVATNGNGYRHEVNGHHKDILIENGSH
jgi:hypothetical protein